ncbi:MAG: bifunctional folylpolyglutamate synthase/dihydrofolate synthase [Candidatus Omnitrophica bacterium]|nr:bifunctional folylpolyglutamate synthase/dihydrofolate synthase [Candidatus Omnitrophota bacterium]
MTEQEAFTYLDSLVNYERAHQPQAMRGVRLERMWALCERIGNPQRAFRSILVAGTNGKGSVCAMIYAILRAARVRVGVYTSPHLHDVRERIRVDAGCETRNAAYKTERSDWIREQELASLLGRIREASEHLPQAERDGPPTYFEVVTAAALLHFADRRVEVAVLEVGLGGRLDATNVVEPVVSIIGPIGFDHTDILGESLAAIAGEKAGIIKPKGIILSASQPSEAAAVIRETAASRECRLFEVGEQLSATILAHDPQGMQLTIRGVRGDYQDVELSLIGRHQADSAALAVAAVELLSETGVPHAVVRSGLAQVAWPGRLEIVRHTPTVVLDGAHNPQAMWALRSTLQDLWPGRAVHLVLGLSQDKSVHAIGEILGPLVASVTCTTSRHPRAYDPEQLAEHLRPFHRVLTVISDAADAYTYVLNTAKPEDVIVITGSLFLVGELRGKIQRPSSRRRVTAGARQKEVATCRS